jgi:REP element-mobilizing transposase RayT
MSQAYKIHKQDAAYFMTFQIVNWIDIFTRKRYRDIVIDSMKYCIQNKGLTIYSYVIMSNHVHLLASAEGNELSEVVGGMKSITSRRMIESIFNEPESRRDWMIDLFKQSASSHKRNTNYQIWTHENHAVECYSPKFTWQRINYIHENPVRAGIVDVAENYVYSSAINYANGTGLIPICILHPHFVFS